MRGVILIFSILLLTFLSGCSENESVDVQKEVDLIIEELVKADKYVEESMNAIVEKDYNKAREYAIKAKESTGSARKHHLGIKERLDKDDAEFIEKFIEYEDRWATLSYKTANIHEIKDQLFDQILEEEAELALPKVELLERGFRENAEDWGELAIFLSTNMEFLEKVGIGENEVESIYSLSDATYELADMLNQYGDILKSQVDGYTPVAEREIVADSGKNNELIPGDVAEFFDSFDKDGNGKLSIREAEEFFYWVENNIAYRYDDEEAENTIIGFEVGDGREGSDYRQTPIETLRERAGDCEDMATFEVAFYRYFGIEAYVVGVDTNVPGIVDHAAAIVKIGDNKEKFRETLGNLLYYEMNNARDVYGNRISDGLYMIVDNSYSGAFGYISGGVEGGTFTIYCIIPLEKGYGEEWNGIVEDCVTMD